MHKITKDPSGTFFWLLRLINLKIISSISTFICIIILKAKNVHIGRGSTFFGIPYIYRTPGSVIKFGNNITIRSDKTSNLIGINRKTIISTLAKDAIIELGNNIGLSGVTIGCINRIVIGDNTLIGANTVITDFDWHSIDPQSRLQGIPKNSPIYIEKNVWIGLNCTLLKGVTIGENSVIGANSVVVSNIDANVIACGNPCKVIKSL